MQPLDQGIINCLKLNYKKFLLKKYIYEISEKDFLNKINLLESIKLLSTCWNKIDKNIIKNCFLKTTLFQENKEL